MKRSTRFQLALFGLMGLAIGNVCAGSAVAWGPHGHVVYSFGHPVEMAKRRALGMARLNGWNNVRIIAASDVAGYGAIAVARHPNGVGSLIGVSLGNSSATEAERLAIEHCIEAGGTNPKITSTFRG